MNRIGIKALEERIAQSKVELAAIEADITCVEELRDDALKAEDKKIAQAERDCRDKLVQQDLLRATADARIGEAEQHRQQACDLEKAAAELRTLADQMDLLERPLEEAKAAQRASVKYWAGRLSEVQPPHVRRKRAQLAADIEKLERRMARKATEPEPGGVKPVIPPNYGTPQPEPTPKVDDLPLGGENDGG